MHSGVLSALVKLADCCGDVILDGPSACTCWEPVYSAEQTEPDRTAAPVVGPTCGDCAYRPDSPERVGDDRYVPIEDVPAGEPFWCHRGMRKPVAYRHPAGITVTIDGDFYEPPQRRRGRLGVPYKADGTPGDLCGGWAARYRRDAEHVLALLAEATS